MNRQIFRIPIVLGLIFLVGIPSPLLADVVIQPTSSVNQPSSAGPASAAPNSAAPAPVASPAAQASPTTTGACEASSYPSGVVPEQVRHYCDAAKASESSTGPEKAMGGLWAAVAVVCTTACVAGNGKNPWTAYLEAICSYSTMGAGLADAIATKNFVGAISGIGMGAVNLAVQGGFWKATAKDSKIGDRMMSCTSAVTATTTSLTKFMSANQSQQAANQNRLYADSLASNTNAATIESPTSTADSANRPAPATPIPGAGLPAATDTSNPCSVASATGSLGARVSCAVANDSTLPGFVRHPGFPEAFKDLTKVDLGTFMDKAESNPGRAIAAAAGSVLGGDSASKLAALNDQIAATIGKSAYAYSGDGAGSTGGGGGGSRGSAGLDDSGPDFNSLMAGLMDQMNPKDPKEEIPPGMTPQDYAALKRNPAQVAEDRSISIFQRVSFRYFHVTRRVLNLPQADPLLQRNGIK